MRILGEHFNRDGQPKRGYPTRMAAERAVREDAMRPGRQYATEIYRCTFCNKWHRASATR